MDSNQKSISMTFVAVVVEPKVPRNVDRAKNVVQLSPNKSKFWQRAIICPNDNGTKDNSSCGEFYKQCDQGPILKTI